MRLRSLLVSLAIVVCPIVTALPGVTQVEVQPTTANEGNVTQFNLFDRWIIEYPQGWRSVQSEGNSATVPPTFITNVSEADLEKIVSSQADDGWEELPPGWVVTFPFVEPPFQPPTSPDQTFERINATMDQFGTIDRRETLVINGQRAARYWLSTINGSPASFYGKAVVTATLFQDGTILVLNSVYDPTQAASALPAIERLHNSLRQSR